jgi:hypothetical protein
MNEVKYYNAGTALTTTPTTILDFAAHKYTMIRIKNETSSDIILTFYDNSGNAVGQPYLTKASDDLIQAFVCSGKVTAETTTGTSSGNFFVQLTRG